MTAIQPATPQLWTPYDRMILKSANLVAYWPGKEVAGTRGSDVKGGRHGSYVAAPVMGEVGPLVAEPDTAVLYDGTSQYLTVPHDAALVPCPNITVEAWVKPIGASGTIVGCYNGGQLSFLLEIGSAGQLYGFLVGAASINFTGAGTDLRDGLWHHVALVGTATTNDLYRDGVVERHTDGSWTTTTGHTNPLFIGCRSIGPVAIALHGTIAKVAIYSRSLPIGEIASHNAAGRA